jgi:hypothetical protein
VGKMIYDGTSAFTFDDRVLAHLQIVIGAKLRRREGFLLIWTDRTTLPEGALHSIWLDPSISIQFAFTGTTMPEIEREWLEILTEKANSSPGLRLDDNLRAEIREELPRGTAKAQRGRRPQKVPSST